MASGPKKATKIALPRSARRHELERAAFDSAIAQVRGNTPGARRGKDPEAVHQLRVGFRRLRVALRLFKRTIGEAHRARLEPELRWIFRSLGAVRDYDVLFEQLDPLYPEESPENLERLRAALAREREKLARKSLRDLSSERYRKLIRALRLLAIERAAREEDSPRARKWSRKHMQKRLDAVLARSEAVSGSDPEALHALRKQLKKLRYTADLVATFWPGKRTKRYLRCLSHLQDVLGPINDAAAGSRLLEQVRAKRDRIASRLAEDGQRILAERAEAALSPLAHAFQKFAKKKPFWR